MIFMGKSMVSGADFPFFVHPLIVELMNQKIRTLPPSAPQRLGAARNSGPAFPGSSEEARPVFRTAGNQYKWLTYNLNIDGKIVLNN